MAEWDSVRKDIDCIDNRILELLNERAELVIQVGRLKKEVNANFHVLDREEKIYQRLMEINSGSFPEKAIRYVFREIISASLSLEHPLKIAYLGPEATFTHLAAIQQFGQSANFVKVKNISDIFEEVERERADYGVVPVENSTEGTIYQTLDMFLDSDLKISAEILLKVSHHFLSKNDHIDNIKKIYSHPQAIAQCGNWIANNLPNIPLEETSSTALAAHMAARDPSSGAIAGELAAPLYNLKVLKKNIETHAGNITRFWVLGTTMPGRSGKNKTSIMFSIQDSAGALFEVLKPFSHHKINLTKIESRPYRKKPWKYVFFVDMEGHLLDKNISEALEDLTKKSLFLKILGSYPGRSSPN